LKQEKMVNHLIRRFEGLRRDKDALLKVRWSYCVLDEGHKIRNPDADITLTCKQLQSHHRIILTGKTDRAGSFFFCVCLFF